MDQPEENNLKRKRTKNKEKPQRRGRIIIRNLPFKSTEEKLREHFKEFGNITDINILKRPDGKLVGCAFIQFDVVQSAAKAIHHRSGKEFLGRTIICDWAVAKDTYVKKSQSNEVKEEPIEIKDEKTDNEEDVEEIKDVKDEKSESESESEEEEKNSNDSDDSDDSDENDDDDDEDEEVPKEEPLPKKPRVVSNDVNEGKTIFIKNVPFQATNDDVKQVMSQFGPLYYALVCMDPITEHSKGTAFVKFHNEEDAQKCLEAGTELTLMGNILDCHKALNKSDLDNKKTQKEKKKDSRNLYLVKEGVILAGSKPAQTISATDMAKRLQLERWKTQMLRNLNMFVSKYRLVVHNLPASYDDQKFRKLVALHAGPKCTIKECRVMRNMKVLDNKGKGLSKEYGFVSFENHDDALRVLRSLNNNPNVFSENRRPIVAFSIENKAILNARNKRLEKSKMNNPTYLKKHPEAKASSNKEENRKSKGNLPETDYMGLTAKEGDTKLRSKFKLKTQANIHHEVTKKRKKLLKNKMQKDMKKSNHIRQPQQKQNTKKKKDDDNFSKLVSKYKSNLTTNASNKAKKWYE